MTAIYLLAVDPRCAGPNGGPLHPGKSVERVNRRHWDNSLMAHSQDFLAYTVLSEVRYKINL
jgi:hypothetical protein